MVHNFPVDGEMILVERTEHDPVYTKSQSLIWVVAALVGIGLLFATIFPQISISEIRNTALAWTGNSANAKQPVLPREMRELLAETMAGNPALAEQGQVAEQMNEAMPLSAMPIEAAQPFMMSYAALPIAERALRCLTQAVYYEAGFEPMKGVMLLLKSSSTGCVTPPIPIRCAV